MEKFSFLKTDYTTLIFPHFPIDKWKLHHVLVSLFGPGFWDRWLNPNFLSSTWIPSMFFLTSSCPSNNVPPDCHFANKFPESSGSSRVYHDIKQHSVSLWLHLPDLILPFIIKNKSNSSSTDNQSQVSRWALFTLQWPTVSIIPGFRVKTFNIVCSSHMSHYIG